MLCAPFCSGCPSKARRDSPAIAARIIFQWTTLWKTGLTGQTLSKKWTFFLLLSVLSRFFVVGLDSRRDKSDRILSRSGDANAKSNASGGACLQLEMGNGDRPTVCVFFVASTTHTVSASCSSVFYFR